MMLFTRVLLFALLLAAWVCGQRVTIRNLGPWPQDGWCSFVVPAGGDEGAVARLQPQGWPAVFGRSSGVRGRMVHIRCGSVEPLQQIRGTLEVAEGDVPVEAVPPEETAHPPRFLRVNGRLWTPMRSEVERDGPRVIVHLFGPVLDTMLKAHAWLYFYPGSRVVPFEVYVANCDQTVQGFRQDIESIELETPHGTWPAVDFLLARGGAEQREVGGKVVARLLSSTWIGHGQGVGWTGRLILWGDMAPGDVGFESLASAAQRPLVGMSLDWHESWGPWGVLPQTHPAFLAERAAKIRRDQWRAFESLVSQRGGVWRVWPWGLNNVPSGTGAQQDFGVTKLAPAFVWSTRAPEHLWALIPSVLRDGGRPSFFYENDGRPLDLAQHPRWVTWGLHTHYNPNASKDRLGKGSFSSTPWNVLSPKDFAHCSSNNLAGWTCLTGSELGKHLCRQEITDFVAWDRFFGLGEERAWGRTPLAATWDYLATGDERVFQGFDDVPLHRKFDWLLGDAQQLDVRPLGVGKPDFRYFNGKYPYWNPWHQGLCIAGLDAMAQVRPSERLDRILFELCRTHVKDAWVKLPSGWRVGYAVRWLDGKELTAEQKLDADYFAPSFGTNFNEWCIAAVVIAMRRLEEKEPALAARAASIATALHLQWASSEPKVGLGRLGRGAEWRAVK